MSSPFPVIEARNVSKIYDMGKAKVTALKNVNLRVRKGDYISITGPSGSGKTTLLDVLSALLRPTHGEVLVKGMRVSRMKDNALAQVRGKTIGFVFQTFNLIPRMSAWENVMLPLWFQRIPLEERKKTAMQCLESVGLGNRLHHTPNQLSGGQRQRVAIARALAVNPDIIVADEPTGNLDSESGAIILNVIDELHQKQGKTIVMVTHERYVAERAEKIVHMKDGKIVSVEKNSTHSKKVRRNYK